jgi:hypothetical protein
MTVSTSPKKETKNVNSKNFHIDMDKLTQTMMRLIDEKMDTSINNAIQKYINKDGPNNFEGLDKRILPSEYASHSKKKSELRPREGDESNDESNDESDHANKNSGSKLGVTNFKMPKINLETKLSEPNNFMTWRVIVMRQMKGCNIHEAIIHDLNDIRNEYALDFLSRSVTPNMLSHIVETESAKMAWDTLTKYCAPEPK